MSEAKILVPSFGNWDMAANISYTVVFDKARALKDASSESPNANCLEGNPSCIQAKFENNSFHQNSDLTMASSHRSDRCSLKERHSWRQNTDLHYETGTSSSRRSSLHYETGTSSSRRSTLQQTAHHILAESQYAASNGSPAESWRSISSRHSKRIPYGVSKNNIRKPLGKDIWPIDDPSVGLCPSYQHRMCRKQLPTSPAKDGKTIRSYSLERGILPKFGDWDATDLTSGEDFSVIFNKARDERKSRNPCDGTLKFKAPPGIDEDLYKPNLSRKSSSGIWSLLLCCSHASAA